MILIDCSWKYSKKSECWGHLCLTQKLPQSLEQAKAFWNNSLDEKKTTYLIATSGTGKATVVKTAQKKKLTAGYWKPRDTGETCRNNSKEPEELSIKLPFWFHSHFLKKVPEVISNKNAKIPLPNTPSSFLSQWSHRMSVIRKHERGE